jgi:NAD(P)-dependent dehydrogenase (short-subunit alcohol dehydrogenase family)
MDASVGRLASKTAIVTGAGSGIGRAVAHALARHGAAVVVADIRRESADAVVAEICDAGGQAKAAVADVSDEPAVRRMVDVAVEAYGGLDILHNNASDLDLLRRDLDVVGTDVGVWNRTLGVSLTGPMLGCKHAIPHMLERGGG